MDLEEGDDLQIIEPLCAVFRRKLRTEGQKYTPERAQILDAIIEMDDVFEAEQLLERMKSAGFRVSKATIYRTIKLLSEAGIIQQVLLAGDQAHYQLAYGQRSGGILVDVTNNQVTPLDIPDLTRLRDRICAEHGLKAEGHRLVIYGRSGGTPDQGIA